MTSTPTPARPRFGICNEIFKEWPFEKAFRFIAETGYDAVEIAPFTLTKDVRTVTLGKRRELRDLAVSSGLAISGIHWVLVQTEGLHVTHPDREVRQRTSDYFRALVDFCADLGGDRIILGSPKQRDLMDGVGYEAGWGWASEVFRPAVDLASERKVVLCFEPLAPSETNFINTAAEAIRFTSAFQSEWFKIILDVKAMSSESKPIPQIIRESWPHFAYFHANDSNLKGPGFGEVDFKPIAAALREVGYSGTVSVEVFKFEEGPEAIATRSLEYLRRCFV